MKDNRARAEKPDDKSFAEILSEFERDQAGRTEAPRRGKAPGRAATGRGAQAREGTVVAFTDELVLINYGTKTEGVIPLSDVRDAAGNITVKKGDKIDVVATGRKRDDFMLLSRLTGPRPRDWEELRDAFENKEIVAGRVTGTTKGGLTVDLGARAFLPASRSGARTPAETEALVGQEVRVRIIEFDPDDENVVVDRRAVLEEEARRAREAAFGSIEEGAVVRGTVRSLTDFGAFVDLGGVDGLLHVIDMSWSRIKDPRSELQVGDTLDLKVLKIDREHQKISLGLKQMYPDPWDTIAQEVQPGDRVRGTVTRLTDFGAFVEVRPGVEGLIHVSEMSWTKRVRKPSDVLRKGEDVEAVVLKVEPANRKLSLGLKQALGNPWDTIEQRYPAGTLLEGTVRRLQKFGAFVEIEEGIDGLIHVSDLTGERRVEHPSEVVKVGERVKVIVVEADREKRRLKLSMKQLEATSLDEYMREHKAGDRVTGRVVRVEDQRATVQLGEGVEGVVFLGGEPTAPEARGALGAALAAAWKGRMPEAAPPTPPAEPLREGQLRSFVIRRVDPSSKRIELQAA